MLCIERNKLFLLYKIDAGNAKLQERKLRACLEHSFFIGILENFIPLERKPVRAFGTQESNISFPIEHCSFFAVSRESKTPLKSLVSDSFVEAQGDYGDNSSEEWLSTAKSGWMSKYMGPTIVKRV